MKRYWLIGVLLLLPLLAAAQKIDSKKCYELVTPDGWVLDVQGAVQTDTPILLSKREAGNAGQVWQLRPLGKNVYQLVNGLSALALDCDGEGEHKLLPWSDAIQRSISESSSSLCFPNTFGDSWSQVAQLST